ncbi:MAG: hypothetical protein RLN88_08485 [Ekhidna sp.]|uniref:hypothetical protein n=1 Tax=Ekhidna sp. TaxID=2608089 RepID=UPI0032ED3F32
MLGEIFAIECPIEDEIKALTLRYGHIPKEVRKSQEFYVWSRMIRKKGLKPRFTILDSNIDGIDQSLLFNMYIDLFKGWDVGLFNFTRKNSLKISIKSAMFNRQKIKVDITDLGYFELALDKLMNDSPLKIFIPFDLALELVLYCCLYRILKTDHLELLEYKKFELFEQLPSNKSELVATAYSLMMCTQIGRRDEDYAFRIIRELSTTQIVKGINLIFKTFSFRISLDRKAWINLNGILGYLHDEKEYRNNPFFAEIYDQLLKA